MTVSILWQEEGYTVKYGLSPKEIPRANPKGFPEGSGYISPYIPTRVTIQTFSITIPVLCFLGEKYWESWFSLLLWTLRQYFPVYSQSNGECTGKYTPSSTGSIFYSTLPVELDLYGKIIPTWLRNTGELCFNIIMFSIEIALYWNVYQVMLHCILHYAALYTALCCTVYCIILHSILRWWSKHCLLNYNALHTPLYYIRIRTRRGIYGQT